MISYLEGKILHKEPKFIVLDVNGVGYKVFGTEAMLNDGKIGSPFGVWTYLAVRENALDLYGFKERDALNFFELLITISGIGPRTALGVLNVAAVKTIKQAVSSGDISYLTKVSGIGKKIAEKIILELRDKFEAEDFTGTEAGFKGEADVIEALKSLGYAEREARDALKKVLHGEKGAKGEKSGNSDKGEKNEIGELSTGEKVKRALKILSVESGGK